MKPPVRMTVRVDNAVSVTRKMFLRQGDGDPREPFASIQIDQLGSVVQLLVHEGYQARRLIEELEQALVELGNDNQAAEQAAANRPEIL